MPTSSTPADQLRQRAHALRSFASRLTSAEATSLTRLAGSDTWFGPTPNACTADLRFTCDQLQSAGADLHLRAQRLERRAAELDVIAAAATIGTAR